MQYISQVAIAMIFNRIAIAIDRRELIQEIVTSVDAKRRNECHLIYRQDASRMITTCSLWTRFRRISDAWHRDNNKIPLHLLYQHCRDAQPKIVYFLQGERAHMRTILLLCYFSYLKHGNRSHLCLVL